MSFLKKALTKSPWVFHLSTGSCNNCDIEIIDCLTPRFDVERFGVMLVGSIRHADIILITGSMNKKSVKRVKVLYEQAPRPCAVVACGTCSCGGHFFRDSYNTDTPVSKTIPVDVYIPGCPPKPEALIAGIVKALGKLDEKRKNR
ncbi:MAG: NADH-quinone oxidoreductase subunit B family protein [Candidatus Omnitrophica bacterium]|nr:NADH-quinone oxidoreductase subunit B family protein [Candidatus Omnitrophota bacterium]